MSASTTARLNGKAAKRRAIRRRQLKTVLNSPAGKTDNPFVTDGCNDAEKHSAAAALTKMIGHRLSLVYMPGASYTNEHSMDEPSKGHLFSAYIEEHTDDEGEDFGESLHVTLDDRLGDVRLQFIAELRRIAKVFNGMADLVEQKADDVQARYTKLGSFPQPKLESGVDHE